MAKGVSKGGAATIGKDAQSRRKPTKPTGSAKTPKVSVAPRKSKEEPDALTVAIASLYDTATEIVAGRLKPTIDHIKALAHAVIGQEEKKARKARAKAEGSGKAKKPKTAKAAVTAAKPKKKKK